LFIKSPNLSNSSKIVILASGTFNPANNGICGKNFPPRSIDCTYGRSNFLNQTVSVLSPNVQTITSPVPLSICTFSSSIIVTDWPKTGTIAFLFFNFLYRISFGLYKTATQEGKSSGLVVAISKSWLSSVLKIISLKNESFSSSSRSA